MSGVNLLAPGGAPKSGKWRGGEGMVAVGGRLGGATIQLRWAAHIDALPVPLGSPIREAGRLFDAFIASTGLLSIEVSDRSAETFVSVDVFPVSTTYLRVSESD